MLSLIPHIAYAAGPSNINELVRAINKFIINPIIILLFILAIIYFIYGIIEFIINSKNPEGRQTGGKHVMWGLVGMLIMIGVFFIMNLLLDTAGVSNVNPQAQTGEFVNITVPNISPAGS